MSTSHFATVPVSARSTFGKTQSRLYFTAPPVMPEMKRSRNKL